MMTKEGEETHDVYLAAVECGGTSFVLSVGRVDDRLSPPFEVVWKESVETKEDPEETLKECADLLSRQPYTYAALGIATFGPVGLNRQDKGTYGRILSSSPKHHWRNVDLVTPLLKAVGEEIPHLLETDVNAPAYAEYLWATTNTVVSSVAYVTVGTGVGVGLVMNGQPVHGMMHPEGGHVIVKPLPNDTFEGYSWGKEKSPYGGVHTVEGIASSVALTERLGNNDDDRNSLADISNDNDIWDHAANALANLCVSLILLTSVQKIVFGGGVMNRSCLYDKIQTYTQQHLNNYIPQLPSIGPSQWKEDSGMMGALVLAHQAYIQKDHTNKNKNKALTSNQFLHGILVGAAVTSMVLFQMIRSK